MTASVAVRYDFSDDWSAQFTWDNYNDNTQLVDLLIISTTGGPNLEGANGFALISPFHGKAESADRSRANDYTTTYSSGNFMSTIQGNNYALAIDGRIGNHDLKFITSMMDTKERMDICSWGSPIPGIIFPFGTGTPDNPSDAPCLFPVLREQNSSSPLTRFRSPLISTDRSTTSRVSTQWRVRHPSNQARYRSSSLCRT